MPSTGLWPPVSSGMPFLVAPCVPLAGAGVQGGAAEAAGGGLSLAWAAAAAAVALAAAAPALAAAHARHARLLTHELARFTETPPKPRKKTKKNQKTKSEVAKGAQARYPGSFEFDSESESEGEGGDGAGRGGRFEFEGRLGVLSGEGDVRLEAGLPAGLSSTWRVWRVDEGGFWRSEWLEPAWRTPAERKALAQRERDAYPLRVAQLRRRKAASRATLVALAVAALLLAVQAAIVAMMAPDAQVFGGGDGDSDSDIGGHDADVCGLHEDELVVVGVALPEVFVTPLWVMFPEERNALLMLVPFQLFLMYAAILWAVNAVVSWYCQWWDAELHGAEMVSLRTNALLRAALRPGLEAKHFPAILAACWELRFGVFDSIAKEDDLLSNFWDTGLAGWIRRMTPTGTLAVLAAHWENAPAMTLFKKTFEYDLDLLGELEQNAQLVDDVDALELELLGEREASEDDVAGTDGFAASCTICVEEFKVGEGLKVLSCGHLFHPDCVDEWLNESLRCPNCNAQVQLPVIPPYRITDGNGESPAGFDAEGALRAPGVRVAFVLLCAHFNRRLRHQPARVRRAAESVVIAADRLLAHIAGSLSAKRWARPMAEAIKVTSFLRQALWNNRSELLQFPGVTDAIVEQAEADGFRDATSYARAFVRGRLQPEHLPHNGSRPEFIDDPQETEKWLDDKWLPNRSLAMAWLAVRALPDLMVRCSVHRVGGPGVTPMAGPPRTGEVLVLNVQVCRGHPAGEVPTELHWRKVPEAHTPFFPLPCAADFHLLVVAGGQQIHANAWLRAHSLASSDGLHPLSLRVPVRLPPVPGAMHLMIHCIPTSYAGVHRLLPYTIPVHAWAPGAHRPDGMPGAGPPAGNMPAAGGPAGAGIPGGVAMRPLGVDQAELGAGLQPAPADATGPTDGEGQAAAAAPPAVAPLRGVASPVVPDHEPRAGSIRAVAQAAAAPAIAAGPVGPDGRMPHVAPPRRMPVVAAAGLDDTDEEKMPDLVAELPPGHPAASSSVADDDDVPDLVAELPEGHVARGGQRAAAPHTVPSAMSARRGRQPETAPGSGLRRDGSPTRPAGLPTRTQVAGAGEPRVAPIPTPEVLAADFSSDSDDAPL